MHESVFLALAEAARHGEPVSLGVISGVKGSSPQKLGAKAVFFRDGRIVGTLGGGCLEAEIQRRAISALQANRPEEFELVLDHDFGWDDGLICGGKVQGLILPQAQSVGEAFWTRLARRREEFAWGVTPDFVIRAFDEPGGEQDWRYREQLTQRTPLWIAGAGHIAQAVAPLAVQLDFAVTVFDDRPALASSRFFPPTVTLVTESWDQMLKRPPSSEQNAFGLIVTRGHRHDALVLREWLGKEFAFLGTIGSKRKARMIFDHFIAEKIATKEQLAGVACPVGIDIQSQSVMEIAVSIAAQLVQRRAALKR